MSNTYVWSVTSMSTLPDVPNQPNYVVNVNGILTGSNGATPPVTASIGYNVQLVVEQNEPNYVPYAQITEALLVDSFLSAIPEAYLEPTAVALTKDPAPALGVFFALMTTGPAQTQRLVADALKVPVPALQAYLRAMARDPLNARQAQLRLPVLQLASGPGAADPTKEAATLAQYGFKDLPAFRVIHFPTAKHWIMWDAPEAFLLALRAFEAGLGR